MATIAAATARTAAAVVRASLRLRLMAPIRAAHPRRDPAPSPDCGVAPGLATSPGLAPSPGGGVALDRAASPCGGVAPGPATAPRPGPTDADCAPAGGASGSAPPGGRLPRRSLRSPEVIDACLPMDLPSACSPLRRQPLGPPSPGRPPGGLARR